MCSVNKRNSVSLLVDLSNTTVLVEPPKSTVSIDVDFSILVPSQVSYSKITLLGSIKKFLIYH